MSAYQSSIRPAGQYLLKVLKQEGEVPYGRFYGDKDQDQKLLDGVLPFYPPCEGEEELEDLKAGILEEGHLCVEWAAWQLKDFGVVEIVESPDAKLIDGEPDFLIRLTGRGKTIDWDIEPFGFRDLNARFDASGASRWLIVFAETNHDGAEAFDFGAVAEVGATDGGVAVLDDCGNRYGPKTTPYRWAFQVSLWHHARSGNVELVFKNAGQQKTWADTIGKKQHLFRSSEFPEELMSVGYRVTQRVIDDTECVSHVKWIGGE